LRVSASAHGDRSAVSTVDLAAVRRVCLFMYVAGVFGLACAIFGPDPRPEDHGALAIVIGCVLVGLTVLIIDRRATVTTIRVHAFWMVATICVCLAVARPTNGVPLYLLLPALLGAYALPRRDFGAVLVALGVGLAIAVAGFVEPPARLALGLDAALTVGFAALVVRYLRETLDSVVARLGDVAHGLHETARRDPLTRLPNRQAFDEALARGLARADSSDHPLALILLDLDHFKRINDTYGHAAGDASLREFAFVAKAEVRSVDVFARIGGEEFALVLFDTDADEARKVAERIAARVRHATLGGPVRLSISAGIAHYGPGRSSPDALLAAADTALYAAKQAGRRRVAVDGPTVRVSPEILPEGPAAAGASTPTAPEPDVDVDAVPVQDEGRLMRRVAVYQFAAGVPALAISAVLPGIRAADITAIAALCALMAACAVALLHAPALPRRVYRVVPFIGVFIISAGVAVNDPISGTPFFYVWPAVFTAYFFDRRLLIALLGFICATYAPVLILWVEAPLKLSDFTTVVAPVAVAAWTVAVVRQRVRTLLAELHHRLERLRHAADRDPLTDALNRRAFDAILTREANRATRSNLDLSLILFDVDHFKLVNDRFGHAAGDQALVRIASTIADAAGPINIAARLGGEEFAMLLVNADQDAAERVAEQVHGALAESAATYPTHLTVSAGVATLSPQTSTPDTLLLAADRALYRAKQAGRARTETADPAKAPA
jgi:diguanylate cyclase (GGDEF)-like protein